MDGEVSIIDYCEIETLITVAQLQSQFGVLIGAVTIPGTSYLRGCSSSLEAIGLQYHLLAVP